MCFYHVDGRETAPEAGTAPAGAHELAGVAPADTPNGRRAAIKRAAAAALSVGALPLIWPSIARAKPKPAATANGRRVVDMTHTLSEDFPIIPVEGLTYAFSQEPLSTLEKDGVNAFNWRMFDHMGTHIDAPFHFRNDKLRVDELPVDSLICPLAVVDIRERAARDHTAEVTVDDVLAYEREHGRLPAGAMVAMNSGWEARLDTPGAFVNIDASGVRNHPGFSAEVCDWLAVERRIGGLGCDVISFDPGPDLSYAAHKALFAHNRWAVENVAGLDRVPPAGATAFVGGYKVRGASGAPCRLIATW